MRALWTLAWLVACGSDATEHEVPEGTAQIGGDIVSTVNGHPIHDDSVLSLARSADLDADEALARRQAEELLALEAYRRGFGSSVDAEQQERERLVQALLDRVNDSVPFESISDDEVSQRFAQQSAALGRPERRKIRQIVVRVDDDADPERWDEAERLALRLRGEWQTDPDAFARYRDVDSLEGFPLQVEASGRITQGNLQSLLDAAVFRQPEVGLLSEAYRSSGGWHAIEVTEIEPAVAAVLEDHVDRIRDELANERRRDALIQLADDAEQRFEVEIDEVVAARALAMEPPP